MEWNSLDSVQQYANITKSHTVLAECFPFSAPSGGTDRMRNMRFWLQMFSLSGVTPKRRAQTTTTLHSVEKCFNREQRSYLAESMDK